MRCTAHTRTSKQITAPPLSSHFSLPLSLAELREAREQFWWHQTHDSEWAWSTSGSGEVRPGHHGNSHRCGEDQSTGGGGGCGGLGGSHSSLFGEQMSLLPPFSQPLEGINLCEEKTSLRAPDQLYGDGTNCARLTCQCLIWLSGARYRPWRSCLSLSF